VILDGPASSSRAPPRRCVIRCCVMDGRAVVVRSCFLFYRWLTAPLFSLLRGLGACVGMQAVLGCDCWGGCGGPSGLDIFFKPLYCEHYDLHVRPQLSSPSILLCCFCHPSFPVRSSFELHHRRQAWADGSVRFPPLDLVWDLTAGHCLTP
jgi:hypothetical protein